MNKPNDLISGLPMFDKNEQFEPFEQFKQTPTVELILDNCIEAMKDMLDGSVDAIICDPPYGNGTEYASYDDTALNLQRLVNKFMPEALRVAGRVLVTCGVSNIYKYPEPNWILSWATPAGTGSSSWGFCCWQPILAYGQDPYLASGKGRRPDTIVFTGAAKQNGHPCPKPVTIMKWIIERCTLPGETVLDPFMGSGTTGVACIKTGRNFIGIEMDPGYFKIAQEQIAEAQTQPKLL